MHATVRLVAAAGALTLLAIMLMEADVIPPWAGLVGVVVLVVAFVQREARRLEPLQDFAEEMGRGPGGDRLGLPTVDRVGRLAAALDAMADRLERRKRALTAEADQKSAILSAMGEGVLALDGERRLLLMNEAARNLLATPLGWKTGTPLSDVTRAPAILGAVERCLDEGERVVEEFQALDAGRDRVLVVTASPRQRVTGGEREPACVVVIHEVTEIRRLEQVRRDFVANVSHELKTPLTSIRGYVEAVLDDPEMPAAMRSQFLGKVQRNSDRIRAIVTDLLDLARIERDDMAGDDPVELGAVVAHTVESCREAAVAKDIELTYEGAPGPLALRGDAQALGTAVSNLLENALKYTPSRGHVRVSVGALGDEAYVDVSDDGPGIAPHEQERVFERFYRVDKDRSRELGGTGLGLSIVRNVARSHGGGVSLSSRLGEGSRFRLTLPLARSA